MTKSNIVSMADYRLKQAARQQRDFTKDSVNIILSVFAMQVLMAQTTLEFLRRD
jgi:hypothetical protein